MSEDREPFLDRWSRLKTKEREAAQEPPAAAPVPAPVKAEEALPLPNIEDLKPDSDFRPFMNASVDPATRRDALKKLFADAHFNTPDPFEPFSGDLRVAESISPELLKTLNQAKKLLFEEAEKTAAQPEQENSQPKVAEANDAAGSKDT
jgi:hypothetical protein